MSGIGDIHDVEGAFSNADESVINWKGANYFKSCDAVVTNDITQGASFCVKREGHPGDIHEDIDGVRKTDPKGRYAIIVTVPMAESSTEGFKDVSDVMQALKKELGGTRGRLIYNAIRETADQVIMILEGDG